MPDADRAIEAFHDEMKKISFAALGSGFKKSMKPTQTTQKSFGMSNKAPALSTPGGLMPGVKVPKLNLPGVQAVTVPSSTNQKALLSKKLSNISIPPMG